MHILAPPFRALKGDVHSCPVSHLNLLPWCLPHPTDWLFLTKNKAIKRSVRSPKFLCVFPECLRTKLSSVKVIPDLVFTKATDNLPPTWMVQGMSVFMNQAECSSLNCRVAAESKGKIEPSVAAGTPEASCTYLDVVRESETVGQAQGNSKYTRENGRGKCSITTILASWSWKKIKRAVIQTSIHCLKFFGFANTTFAHKGHFLNSIILALEAQTLISKWLFWAQRSHWHTAEQRDRSKSPGLVVDSQKGKDVKQAPWGIPA